MSSKAMSRRTALKAMAAAAGGAILAGCGGTPVPTPTPQVIIKEVTKEVPKEVTKVVEKQVTQVVEKVVTAVPQKTGPTLITQYMNANMFAEADAFTEAQAWTVHLPKFNKDNKDQTLRAEPVAQAEFVTKLAAMTQAKELGNALLWISAKPLGDFAREKLVLPLDDLAKQAGVDLAAIYDQRALDLCRYDITTNAPLKGPLWALPMTINPGVGILCYNATMLQAAGADIPKETWTYDDVLANAKKVAKANVFGYQHIRGGGGAGSHSISNDYAYIAPFGGYIFDRAGKKALMNTPESVAGWAWIYDLIFSSKVAPSADDTKAFGDYKQAHMNSKLAMYKEGPWGAMHYRLIPEKGKPGYIEAGEVPAPKGTSGRRGNTLGTDAWGISTNATDPAGCLKALLWMTNLDASLYRSKGAFSAGSTKSFFTNEWALKDPFVSNTLKIAAEGELPYYAANGRDAEITNLLKQKMVLLDGGTQKVTQAFFDDLNTEIQKILDKPAA